MLQRDFSFMIIKMSHWTLGLLNVLKDSSNWIISNDVAVVIEDKYPKAKFHYLVLPRENIRDIFQVIMHWAYFIDFC